MNPTISVIMPAYNAEAFIAESIDSICQQSFNDFELIVLDDCSTDQTRQRIEQKALADPRIQLVAFDRNQGPSVLRNHGLSIARGTFIALMDADDIALPQRFEKQVQLFHERPEVGVCGTWFTYFQGDTRLKTEKHPAEHDEIKVRFLKNNTLGNSTAMLRRQVLGTLRFDPDYVPIEDYLFWSQLIAQTKFHILQESLLWYRLHDQNITKLYRDNARAKIDSVKLGLLQDFALDPDQQTAVVKLLEHRPQCEADMCLSCLTVAAQIAQDNRRIEVFNPIKLEKLLLQKVCRLIRLCPANSTTKLQLLRGFWKQFPPQHSFAQRWRYWRLLAQLRLRFL